jgi:hypothetical protein
MRVIGMAGAIGTTLAVLLAAAPSLAAGLNLECRVHWTKPGGQHRDARRRLDIDLAAKTVRTYDDLGKGWEFKSQHPFPSADKDHFVLEAGDGKDSTLDRRTGAYFFKNARNGVTIRGTCVKSVERPPAF